MNIGYESDELQPYVEPNTDLNDEIRIRKLTILSIPMDTIVFNYCIMCLGCEMMKVLLIRQLDLETYLAFGIIIDSMWLAHGVVSRCSGHFNAAIPGVIN